MKTTFLSILSVAFLCAIAPSQVLVTSDIAVSTTWTANNVYRLENQIYVLPGATLTIEAGTLIASTTNLGGSIAVCRGAQIYVQGTQQNPVIFTSTSDVATWTAGNPKTGTWRAAANEWGNLTIMGGAYISENIIPTNTAAPSPANYATMEGLVAAGPSDTRTYYGGGDDFDDSGSISYVSLRYAGKVIGLGNELNGLSLGGVGRGTDIHHVEIMNNVDDGIEIWGGTVNLKYVSIWNVGDDSFDIDQGWRGKAQFGLIVQGYSVAAAQGSGVGDNCLEMDGAEQSDYQPVTTGTLYNFTVIGQPNNAGGDHATAWRDNCRMQIRNSIIMDIGDRVVGFDNIDGDGGAGYGFNGTLSWAATWTTPYSTTSTVNPFPNPAAFYTAQTSGNLAEIKDTVFFNNDNSAAYTEANARGVFAPANNNVQEPGVSPIVAITRAAPALVFGSLVMESVTFLDPRPANSALTSVGAAPNDGFFTPAQYRGAFVPGSGTWLCGWTASQAFGFTPAPVAGTGQPGVDGAALFDVNDAKNANGCAVGTAGNLNGPFFAAVPTGSSMTLTMDGETHQPIILIAGATLNPGGFDLVFLGLPGAGTVDVGTFPVFDVVADGTQAGLINSMFNTGPTGRITMTLPANFPPATTFNLQCAIFNTTTFARMSDAVQVVIN